MSDKEIIIQKIVELGATKYPDSEIYLYGSRARGNAKRISDWDLLFLLNTSEVLFDLETTIMNEFYDLELETGEVFSPLIYSKSDWNTNHALTSIFENIQKEGIRIK
ncbi:MAG: nucleotidyltransferase domain-containing protein [Bacteroidales bacterium]|nr:nucleotidyltransferase domain-containing protein [Bacteroidales bacterium]